MNFPRSIKDWIVLGSLLLVTMPTSAWADKFNPGNPAPRPFDPDQPQGPSFQPWADPNGLGGRIHDPGSNGTLATPAQGPQAGPSVPDAFARLVSSLAQKACSGTRDTIIWEQPVGA